MPQVLEPTPKSLPRGEGRRERKKRETRARIHECARQLFLDHGFDHTTVEQIAEAADVSQATFFNYFPSKQALLGEMTGEVFAHLQALVEQQLARSASAQDRILRLAEYAAEEIGNTKGLARDVLLELVRTTARPGELAPYLQRLHEPFAAIIREGQERGEVRDDEEATFLAEMVVGLFNSAITNWMSDPAFPVEERLVRTACFVGETLRPTNARVS
jgi:AcrR family transcriptional regulator